MTSVKATYSIPDSSKTIEIPLKSNSIEHLTEPLLLLKTQMNEFLTQILDKEKSTSSIPEIEEQDVLEEESEEIEERPESLENATTKKQKST
ncbi:hypothetical protein BY458DRAFT_509118 [Sporodiniella umbellata]|nr:hypothetical protein BY458DRAFT_509118 [Sporodiniella umbellata]